MSGTPGQPLPPTPELLQALQREFEKHAMAVIAAPQACNQFYIQPYTNGSVALAIGGAQLLPSSNREPVVAVKVDTAFIIDRTVAINLAGFLQYFCKATASEI